MAVREPMVHGGQRTSKNVLPGNGGGKWVPDSAKYNRTVCAGREVHWAGRLVLASLRVMSSRRDMACLNLGEGTVPAIGPGIGLALGGGFARGFAHLGVLQVLEQNHIPISCIAGTSVGSILGAAYASGASLARITATCRTLRFRDIARWRMSRLGLASNHRLGDLIEQVFGSRQFDELQIPLAVVATDLSTGDPVVLSHGSLVDAIRASCAFPGLFEPVEIGTRCLADGGLVAPVPTRAARELGAEYVLGVSVGIQDGHKGAPTNIFQVVSRAVSAAQKHQLEIWERHADLVLRPDVQSLAWDDFHRADEAIEAGVAAARRALPRIQRFLDGAAAPSRNSKTGDLFWLAEAVR